MDILQSSWRGRSMGIRKDSSGKMSTAMIGSKAMLYVPVMVYPDSIYKLSVELFNQSGNGDVYFNIYGNRNFDFPPVNINCSEAGWRTYDIELVVKPFPKTVPLVLRIWREGSTGTVLVGKTNLSQVSEKNDYNVIPKPAQQPLKPNPKRLRLRPRPKPRLNSAKNRVPLKKGVLSPNKQGVRNREIETNLSPNKRRVRQREIETNLSPNKQSVRQREIETNLWPVSPPKILPVTVGEDGIKVSVVMSAFNRREFLNRTLSTYAKQTMLKSEFEIVVVDDGSTEDLLGLCKEYSENYGIQFQYILIDNKKGAIMPDSHTPALSNNIGFKAARGSVIVITGPESLQSEKNLELSWEKANEGYCVYGDVFRSSASFVKELEEKDWRNMSFNEVVEIPQAKFSSSTTTGWWWYHVAVRKEHVLAINGVDEEFMKGLAGEDDDFARRMAHSKVPLFRDHRIIGIHQDHSEEDKKNHPIRFDKRAFKKMREINGILLRRWLNTRDPVTNQKIDWGSDAAIILKEIF